MISIGQKIEEEEEEEIPRLLVPFVGVQRDERRISIDSTRR